MTAAFCGLSYIITSNESSANYPNTWFKGYGINHQFAKSFEFEEMLHNYLKEFISKKIYYFSLLRPFNELQISSVFAELTEYHHNFISCNKGYKHETWCGICDKCIATFWLLAPYLGFEYLTIIFGKPIHKSKSFNKILKRLTDKTGVRAFECIPTIEEIEAASAIINRDFSKSKLIYKTLLTREKRHLVPQEIYKQISSYFYVRIEKLIPISKILIFGYGLEGQSTLKFLKERYDNLSITVLDEKYQFDVEKASNDRMVSSWCNESAAVNFSEFDIIFKAPGITPHREEIEHLDLDQQLLSSNTNLFLELCKGTIIGITGTKGKSTTSTLIYQVLKNKYEVYLLGNIGVPCLDCRRINVREVLFVLELSASQLYQINRSPHISVILGIHPDHLDYFESYIEYVDAKAKILATNTMHDLVLYNEHSEDTRKIVEEAYSTILAFNDSESSIMAGVPTLLIGQFNNYNIWPAILIGDKLGISQNDITATISTFHPLPNRLEQVADKDNIIFISDIRSTTPEVTCAAIEALKQLPGKLETLFLGGTERGQDYIKLIKAIKNSPIRNIIFLPPNGWRIRALFSKEEALMSQVNLFSPNSFEAAMKLVFVNSIYEKSICLLSTAAPSTGGFFESPDDKVSQYIELATRFSRDSQS